MIKQSFDKEELKLVIDDDSEKLELVSSEIFDNSRWSIHHEMIFKDLSTEKFYKVYYSVGATECQDESPFEYDGDTIDCVEVVPVEVTKIEYQNA